MARVVFLCSALHHAAAVSHVRAGGPYTGASLNPARTIGPAAVFNCNVGISFLYIFAEFFGATLAAGAWAQNPRREGGPEP